MSTNGALGRRAALGALLALPSAVRAQGWAPSRPLRLIVPFAAGGLTDILARAAAEPLQRHLGQAMPRRCATPAIAPPAPRSRRSSA